MPVTSAAPTLHESDIGPILQICFCGEYPHGSSGNSAAEIVECTLASAVAKLSPAGVIIDFSELEYTWSDAISRLATPLRRPDGAFLPACIVASGETARSLTPLMGSKWLFGIAGVRLVGTVDDALRDLATRGG